MRENATTNIIKAYIHKKGEASEAMKGLTQLDGIGSIRSPHI